MTRKLAIAAAALFAFSSITLAVREASAFGTGVRLCVQKARKARGDSLKSCRSDALDKYETDFVTCFAPGQGQDCAGKCNDSLTTCLVAPKETRATASTACNDAFKVDVQACNDAATPDTCLATARLKQFSCVQDAAKAVQPDVDTCNQAFTDCAEFCG